jgi:hypothetical protein
LWNPKGNAIDDIYAYNNIGDLVSAVFYLGETRATDLSGCKKVLLELRSYPSMRVLAQDIGKQGHEDYADLSSFLVLMCCKTCHKCRRRENN